MYISLTDKAISRMELFLQDRKKRTYIRLGVNSTGCSGFGYVLEFAEYILIEDKVLTVNDNITILIDPKSLMYLKGVELDFVKEGLNEVFKFKNPNARGECGCGESFNI